MDEKTTSLYDLLRSVSASGRIPFHMPGHQRAAFPWLGDAARIDFTEIDGLDNLHAPAGILKEAAERAALRWGADRSFLLTGGSTVGALASVRAAAKDGSPLILARNCHRSVYHAAMLTRSPVTYIAPRLHPLGFALDIRPEEVERAFEDAPDAAAVVITSPTYDGAVSDIASIARVCHRHGAALIVDAAHGAHLGFLDPSVESPVRLGADLVFMSLHKTLPALTQTAVLHVNGSRIDPDEIAAALGVFETSSPSYPLLASADGCIRAMGDDALFAPWRESLARIQESGSGLLVRPVSARVSAPVPASAAAAASTSSPIPEPSPTVLPTHSTDAAEVFAFDESKLILAAPGMSGPETAEILRRDFRIEPEMVSPRYVLLMTGAGTNGTHADALTAAMASLAARAGSGSCSGLAGLAGQDNADDRQDDSPHDAQDDTRKNAPGENCDLSVLSRMPLPPVRLSMGDAAAQETESLPLEDAAGRVAGEFLAAYPPGIPLAAPGEIIGRELIPLVNRLIGDGIAVTTSRGAFDGTVRVVKEP